MRFRRSLTAFGRRTASLLCGLAVLAAVGYCVALAQGYRFFIEMSGSMAPKITTGSLIISKPVPGSQVHLGDIVSFVAPDGSGRIITHRLHSVVEHKGKVGYRTKGDANPIVDKWILQFPNQVGIEKLSVPLVGYGIYALDKHVVRVAIVGLIGLMFAWIFVGRLWRTELASIRERRKARRADSPRADSTA